MNKKRLIKILKTILPLLLGVFFILYSIKSATPEERETLWQNITKANPFWISFSLFLGILSHLSRAYRWKYLIHPLGYKVKFYNRFMAVMAGYLANLGIPRSGEVLRGASIASYEKVPFEKIFGTIISERVADLLMLLLIISLTLVFQYDQLLYFFEENNINPILSILLLIGVVVAGFWVLKFIRNSTSSRFKKIREFLNGILEGMVSILKMKNSAAFIFHTVFIWVMYIAMFYVVKYAVPGTEALSLSSILVAFIVGSFAISLTNGGIGVYPIAVGAILMVFGIHQQDGEAFGWIVWGTQTSLNLILGGLSLIFLPILNKTN